MDVKTYLQNSLKSDNEELCKGWEYLENNIIDELNNIINNENYWKLQYNKEKINYIIQQLNLELTEEEKKQLGSFVYIYNDKKRKLENDEYKEKMLKQGWNILNEEIGKNAFEHSKKLHIISKQTNDFLVFKDDNIYKPFVNNDGKCFLMKPKARKKGFYLSHFENAFCKLI